MLSNCKVCPRNCGVDRTKGQRGYCGALNSIRVSYVKPLSLEEPCISGTRGSGAIFFSYCSLKCIYCQNYHISSMHVGQDVSEARLGDIFLKLQDTKVHNINLVTPTHYIPQIISVLDNIEDSLHIPVVYNTSGYEKADSIKLLPSSVSVFLTDYKYFDNETAYAYSKAADYVERADEALEIMVKRTGRPVFDENGIMQSGTVIRHLALPGHTRMSKAIIHKLYTKYGDDVYYSIMNQYTPIKALSSNIPEILRRKVTEHEYETIIDYCDMIGMKNVYIQYGDTSDESYIPDFSDKLEY